jgi:hypothetical protein
VKIAATLSALLLPILVAVPLHAAEGIEVQTASVALRDSMLEFSVRAEFPVDDGMRAALEAGAIVDIDFQASLGRRNDFWFDTQVLEASYRRELSWNAPSQRFVLRDEVGGEQRTFATLEEALEAAGRLQGWTVEIPGQLEPEESYKVGVRARLRRGRMPSALRSLTFWTRYWSRSEWYEWALPR